MSPLFELVPLTPKFRSQKDTVCEVSLCHSLADSSILWKQIHFNLYPRWKISLYYPGQQSNLLSSLEGDDVSSKVVCCTNILERLHKSCLFQRSATRGTWRKCLPTCHGDKNRGAWCLQIPGLVISALHSVVYLILGRVCCYSHLAEDHDGPGWQTIHGKPGSTQAWVLNGEVAWVCLLWKGLWWDLPRALFPFGNWGLPFSICCGLAWATWGLLCHTASQVYGKSQEPLRSRHRRLKPMSLPDFMSHSISASCCP